MKCIFSKNERILCENESVNFYLIKNENWQNKTIVGLCEKHTPKRIEYEKLTKEEVMCYEVIDDM